MATSPSNPASDISQVTNWTLEAFRLATSGAKAAAEALASGSEEALKNIAELRGGSRPDRSRRR